MPVVLRPLLCSRCLRLDHFEPRSCLRLRLMWRSIWLLRAVLPVFRPLGARHRDPCFKSLQVNFQRSLGVLPRFRRQRLFSPRSRLRLSYIFRTSCEHNGQCFCLTSLPQPVSPSSDAGAHASDIRGGCAMVHVKPSANANAPHSNDSGDRVLPPL